MILEIISLFIFNSKMRRFLVVILLYFLAFVVASEIVTNSDVGRIIRVPGYEVRAAVKKSKVHNKKKIKKLVLGDSTGYGLYHSEKSYDSIMSFACTQSVSMAGHYFLLKNYMEKNSYNLPDEVVILCNPKSFSNDIDVYAYHYFLKPFPMWEYRSSYSSHLTERVKSIPYYWTAYMPLIHSCKYTPHNSVPKQEKEEALSQISIEYLQKIDSITKEYGIGLRLYSTPSRIDRKEELDNVVEQMIASAPKELKGKFIEYASSVHYYPSKYFHDHVHMIAEYIPQNYLDSIK